MTAVRSGNTLAERSRNAVGVSWLKVKAAMMFLHGRQMRTFRRPYTGRRPCHAPEGVAMSRSRWTRRPEGSTWGDFGADDTWGRLNLIGAEQVRKGVAEVRDGRTFCLSLPLDHPGGMVLNPNRYPPIVRPSLRAGAVNFNCSLGVAHPGATDVVSDDLVVLHTQYSTQWDAFGHAGAVFDADGDGTPEQVYYNGWRADVDVIGPDSPARAGLASLADVEGAAEGMASTSSAGPVDIS